MEPGAAQVLTLSHVPFRFEAADVESYRHALGANSGRIPLGMAMRVLAVPQVVEALKVASCGRVPVHVGQSCHVGRALCIGVDYSAAIAISEPARIPARLELVLRDSSGRTCLTVYSDIALVAP